MNITRANKPSGAFAATACAFFFSAPALLAQEAGSSNALQKYVTDGGPTMIFIGLAVLALIAFIVFNFMNLTQAKFAPVDLRTALLEHMTSCRVRSAIELAASHPSFLGRMMAYALPNIDATRPEDLGRNAVEDSVADFIVNETRKQMAWVNYIGLVAQAAPMLGLLGTVIGMVQAFGKLAETGSADPAQLAGSISVALLTTMWGLITAIPAVIMYFVFKNKLNNLIADCANTSEELINASIQTVNQDAYLAKIPEGIAV